MSKVMWEPSQDCACAAGFAGILALSLMRGDHEVHRAACLETLGHWHVRSTPWLHFIPEGQAEERPPDPMVLHSLFPPRISWHVGQ